MGRNFGARPKRGIPPPPGCESAQALGCTCPHEANVRLSDNTLGVVSAGCPLHGWDPDVLSEEDRQLLFEHLFRIEAGSAPYFLLEIDEADLVGALWDPAWLPVWERCQSSMPQGWLTRLRDEWSWARQDPERTRAAQDRILRTVRRLLREWWAI